jgi:NADPH:quinone reductase-like Zn-dependent oxidoreductase/malonyl CoA-acyl carrier protein transacylase
VVPWVLSGRGADALRGQAARIAARTEPTGEPERPEQAAAAEAARIAQTGVRPADVAHSLLVSRSAFEHRAVILGADLGELRAGAQALAAGDPGPTVVEGVARPRGATVFVFPGQGSQWAGMAVDLLDTSPAFAARMQECEAALAAHVDWSLSGVLRAEPGQPGLDRVDVVQPVLWAVMVSLAELWRSLGVRPDAVLGHSQGEIAAAVVAGALSLPDGALVVALRSRAIAGLAGRGGMVSVPLPGAEVAELIGRWDGAVSVAAVNSPRSTVVSGDVDALAELLADCERRGVRARRIEVDYASHSAHVESVERELARLLEPVRPRTAEVPFFSTVTAGWLDTSTLDAAYWYTNLRQTVRLEACVRALAEQKYEVFVEVSPHPVLTVAVQETAEEAGADAVVSGTLRRDEGGPRRLLRSAAELFVRGVDVDWGQVLAPVRPALVDLPTYAFQHRHFWLAERAAGAGDVGAAGLRAAAHPLLGAAVSLAEGDGALLTGRLSLRTHPWLADHRVDGRVLLPGTAFLELAVRAGDETGCDLVAELALQEPLVVPERGGVDVQVSVSAPQDGRRALAVHARSEAAAGDPWTCHATGVLGTATGPAPVPEPGAWPPEQAQALDAAGLHAWLAGAGLEYGPLFQGLRAVWRRDRELFVEAALPEGSRTDGFGLHPALLDAALHALALDAGDGADGRDGGPRMPFVWAGVRLHATGADTVRVRLTPGAGDTVALAVTDAGGVPVASVDALTLRPLPAAGSRAAAADWLYRVDWIPVPTAETPGGQTCAVIGDPAALVRAGLDVSAHDSLDALLETGTVPAWVVVVLDPAAGTGTETGPELADAVLGRTRHALEIIQTWVARERFPDARLVLLTHGAVAAAAGDAVPALADSGVWGLARSAQSENADRLVLVDVDATEDSYLALPAALAAALAAGEPQLALRGGTAYAPRLVTAGSDPALVAPVGAGNWRLDVTRRGTVDDLALLPAEDPPLAPGQVRVGTRALGLNFRDVLIALDMYPGDTPMGGEGAGVVLEVADDVTAFAPGDRVMGVLLGGFARRAVTDQRLLVPIPDGWSFAQAAAVPVAHVTAYHALVDLAGLTAGESVLIHAAAGGVGMAAVRLARHLGAEVYATASQAKWPAVRELGVAADRIASSRSTDFARTCGAGVDVVLNSLAGAFVDASLGLLGAGGRFVEMGRTDVRDPAGPAASGIRYQTFDLSQLDPDRVGEILAATVGLFADGTLRPAPLTAWDVRHASQAFRHMAQARHIGKIVLTVPAERAPEGTVLVVGGTGALGALAARRLVAEHGVRHLVLASRRGPEADGAPELARELAELGAVVRIVACDATDRGALAAVLADIPADHPLTAVVSTTGVLDDGMITSLTAERIDTVLRSKASVAANLHDLTAGLDLADFVVYSGAAGILGSPGQGSYAAANTVVDALAQHRRARGLAGTALAWGLWSPTSGSGMTGHLSPADLRRLSRAGMGALSLADGLDLFDAALRTNEAALVPIRLELPVLRAAAAAGAPVHPLFRGLVRAVSRRALVPQAAPAASLVDTLAALPEADRLPKVLDLVRGHAAAVLGFAGTEAIEPGRAFKDVGFDSLTAVELRNRLSSATGLRLSATLVFDHPNPRALADQLLAELAPPAHSPAQGVLAELDRIESALTAAAAEPTAHQEITARLELLMSFWRTSLPAPAAPDLADRLQSATADEVLRYIDNEFRLA